MPRVGEPARVISRIPVGGMGEVSLASEKGGTEALPARASDSAQEYQIGDQVYVIEEAGRCVYVSKGSE